MTESTSEQTVDIEVRTVVYGKRVQNDGDGPMLPHEEHGFTTGFRSRPDGSFGGRIRELCSPGTMLKGARSEIGLIAQDYEERGALIVQHCEYTAQTSMNVVSRLRFRPEAGEGLAGRRFTLAQSWIVFGDDLSKDGSAWLEGAYGIALASAAMPDVRPLSDPRKLRIYDPTHVTVPRSPIEPSDPLDLDLLAAQAGALWPYLLDATMPKRNEPLQLPLSEFSPDAIARAISAYAELRHVHRRLPHLSLIAGINEPLAGDKYQLQIVSNPKAASTAGRTADELIQAYREPPPMPVVQTTKTAARNFAPRSEIDNRPNPVARRGDPLELATAHCKEILRILCASDPEYGVIRGSLTKAVLRNEEKTLKGHFANAIELINDYVTERTLQNRYIDRSKFTVEFKDFDFIFLAISCFSLNDWKYCASLKKRTFDAGQATIKPIAPAETQMKAITFIMSLPWQDADRNIYFHGNIDPIERMNDWLRKHGHSLLANLRLTKKLLKLISEHNTFFLDGWIKSTKSGVKYESEEDRPLVTLVQASYYSENNFIEEYCVPVRKSLGLRTDFLGQIEVKESFLDRADEILAGEANFNILTSAKKRLEKEMNEADELLSRQELNDRDPNLRGNEDLLGLEMRNEPRVGADETARGGW